MAAYAALVSLMNDLELIPNHPTHSFSFDNDQITSLSQTVNFLVDFMDRYDFHGYNREAAEYLERRMASAADDAHYLIEAHIVDQIQAGSTLPRKGMSYFLHAITRKAMQFGSTIRGKQRLYFWRQLQWAVECMGVVKREATQFIEEGGLTTEQPTYSAPTSTEEPQRIQFKAKSGMKAEQPAYSAPSTSSKPLTSTKNVMVGFDSVADQLLNILTGEPSNQQLVIPIVGMGGIGKTTLAKYVYENSLIKQHFDLCLWATISYAYDVEAILAQLLSGGNVDLHKKLCGRRYLVVLDDMWSLEAWDAVHMFLPDNGNGSRVIVTTRLSNLAARLSSFSPFEMHFLDEDNSWELFCAKVFGGKKDCPVELEKIGKRIVKKCRGLPLSIVVIGGHLRRSSREIKYWEKFSISMKPIWEKDDECFEILSLSYHYLPPCLKPCFLYMGVFKEDEQINASKLLRLWVAEGFVRANTDQTLEKVAEDYLNDLIERNLILVGERRWNGKVESCVVHDVLRELCLKIAKKEMFLCLLDTTKDMGTEHRIVIPQSSMLDPDVVGSLALPTWARSLTCQGVQSLDESFIHSNSLRLLRVSANVNNMLLEEDGICLPAAHSRQVNLRYLAFSSKKLATTGHFTKRPYLPSSISLFWNMQSIDINNFDVQINAPYEIWKMSQLRHLEFRGFYLPDPLPGHRFKQQNCIVLENLQTLVGVENFRLTNEVCKRMPNIRELSVFYDSFPDDSMQAHITALTILAVSVNWNH